MKFFAALFSLSMLIVPSLASAQTPPAMPPPPGMSPDMASRMQQVHKQMERIHRSARTQVLAALTPAHRALLASIVGQLAIAAHPDEKAAAARLDAALSPGERGAVQRIHDSTRTQMRDVMRQMAQHRPQGAPAPQFREMPQHRTPSAGQFVLEITSGGAQERDMFFMARPGMGMGHFHGHHKMSPPGAPAPAPTNT